MMEGIDNSVAEILAALEQTGRAANTLVIFTSDNGGLSTKPCTSNLPLRAGKGWAYEGGIRVPMIVRWPGKIDADKQTKVPVTSMDFYPTLLTVAGLPPLPKQHKDGVDISSLMLGKSAIERKRSIGITLTITVPGVTRMEHYAIKTGNRCTGLALSLIHI